MRARTRRFDRLTLIPSQVKAHTVATTCARHAGVTSCCQLAFAIGSPGLRKRKSTLCIGLLRGHHYGSVLLKCHIGSVWTPFRLSTGDCKVSSQDKETRRMWHLSNTEGASSRLHKIQVARLEPTGYTEIGGTEDKAHSHCNKIAQVAQERNASVNYGVLVTIAERLLDNRTLCQDLVPGSIERQLY
eukprot:scaffold131_cov125-Cylindrotheca_fusiformis.AAC.7